MLWISKYCSRQRQERVAGSLFSSLRHLSCPTAATCSKPSSTTFTNFHLFLSRLSSSLPSLLSSLSCRSFLSSQSRFLHPSFFNTPSFYCSAMFLPRAENLRPCALSCNLGYERAEARGGRGGINYFICRRAMSLLCSIAWEHVINRWDLLR